jgi:hypothetical protein
MDFSHVDRCDRSPSGSKNNSRINPQAFQPAKARLSLERDAQVARNFIRAIDRTSLTPLTDGAQLSRPEITRAWWSCCFQENVTLSEMQDGIETFAHYSTAEIDAVLDDYLRHRKVALPIARSAAMRRYLRHLPTQLMRQLELIDWIGLPRTPPRGPRDLMPYVLRRTPRFAPGEPLPGLGDHEVRLYHGGGGFGEVYEVGSRIWANRPGSIVKVGSSAAVEKLFRYEAIINFELQSRHVPGIPVLLDTHLAAAPPALYFEDLKGFSLREVLERVALEFSEPWAMSKKNARWARWREVVLDFLIEFTRLLAGVHAARFVHRDIKPENILLVPQEKGPWAVYLIDWGISGQVKSLCPEYRAMGPDTRRRIDELLVHGCSEFTASPQQLKGDLSSTEDDVFATGTVGIMSLTFDLQQRVARYEWQDLLDQAGVSRALIRLLDACVSPESRDRPQDGEELHDRLLKCR